MLIRLESFNAPRVLAGARVQLFYALTEEEMAALEASGNGHFARETLKIRLDWCGDRLYSDWLGGTFIEKRTNIGGGVALNPMDAETARLIDQRVATAMGAVDLVTAVLCAEKGRWSLSLLFKDGVTVTGWTPVGLMYIAELDATPENLPAARARLLRAHYPPAAKEKT